MSLPIHEMQEASRKKKRVQLNTAEKEELLQQIQLDPSNENLHSLADDWNAQHPERPLKFAALKRLCKTRMPQDEDAERFWGTVQEYVERELSTADALQRYQPAVDGFDYTGYKTKRVDAAKIPDITAAQLEALRFPFDAPKYNKHATPAESRTSEKQMRHDFRAHWHAKGIAWAPFQRFVGSEDRKRLDAAPWTPSAPDGPWQAVGEVVMTHARLHSEIKRTMGAAFADVGGETDDRLNPNHETLKRYFATHAPMAARDALSRVLEATEALYRGVATLVPTMERADSKWKRTYGINPEMMAPWLSFLTCLSRKTLVQREHMDDNARGISGLWGLVPNQYVIVWLHSYEMNLELERIHGLFYNHVIAHRKPAGWPDDAFWNLVANAHLEAQGFTTTRRPTPVKVPLRVGDVLLIDFMVIHAGMPFVSAQEPSLRAHLYWAQVAGRDGESASGQTCFQWSTFHPFFPGWRVLSHGRRKFE